MTDRATREQAARSFWLATQHMYALEVLLPDAACADEIVAFHVSQAVQRILEAVLTLASIRHREDQGLAELIDLVADSLPGHPEELEEVRRLDVLARWEDACWLEPQNLDRSRTLHCVRQIQCWAESLRDTLDPAWRRLEEEIKQNVRLIEEALGLRVSKGDGRQRWRSPRG